VGGRIQPTVRMDATAVSGSDRGNPLFSTVVALRVWTSSRTSFYDEGETRHLCAAYVSLHH
jgi:hypothetical protein